MTRAEQWALALTVRCPTCCAPARKRCHVVGVFGDGGVALTPCPARLRAAREKGERDAE